jgi:V/A-type H+-transporting ATPase subunit C
MTPNKLLVDVFRMKYDYHNAKTLIKSEAEGIDRTDLMSPWPDAFPRRR